MNTVTLPVETVGMTLRMSYRRHLARTMWPLPRRERSMQRLNAYFLRHVDRLGAVPVDEPRQEVVDMPDHFIRNVRAAVFMVRALRKHPAIPPGGLRLPARTNAVELVTSDD